LNELQTFENQRLQTELDNVMTEEKEKQDKIEKHLVEIGIKEAQIASLESAITALKSEQLVTFGKYKDDNEAEIKRLMESNMALNNEIRLLNENMDEKKNECKRLDEEKTMFESECRLLKLDLNAGRSEWSLERKDLSDTAASLGAELGMLKGHLAKSLEEITLQVS
jgi:chromosome segregation ATPase